MQTMNERNVYTFSSQMFTRAPRYRFVDSEDIWFKDGTHHDDYRDKMAILNEHGFSYVDYVKATLSDDKKTKYRSDIPDLIGGNVGQYLSHRAVDLLAGLGIQMVLAPATFLNIAPEAEYFVFGYTFSFPKLEGNYVDLETSEAILQEDGSIATSGQTTYHTPQQLHLLPKAREIKGIKYTNAGLLCSQDVKTAIDDAKLLGFYFREIPVANTTTLN